MWDFKEKRKDKIQGNILGIQEKRPLDITNTQATTKKRKEVAKFALLVSAKGKCTLNTQSKFIV